MNKENKRKLSLMIAFFACVGVTGIYAEGETESSAVKSLGKLSISVEKKASEEPSTIDSLCSTASTVANTTISAIGVVGNAFWELSPQNKAIALLALYVAYKVVWHAKIHVAVTWPNGLYLNPFGK